MKKTNSKGIWRRVLSALLTIALLCSLSPSKNFLPVAEATQSEYSGVLLKYDFGLSRYYPPDTKYTDTNDTWKYAGNTAGWTPLTGATGSRKNTGASYVQLRYDNETIGTWFAFELNITTPGRYHVNLIHMSKNVGAIAEMFFMPATTDVEAGLISENSIGEVNYFAYPATNDNNAALADVTATTAGKYLIVFRLKTLGAYGTGDYIYPSSLMLNGTQLESVSLACNENQLGIGESTTSSVTGVLDNGQAADLSRATIRYSSSNSSVATIDEVSGAITTISEGNVDINVAVALDGITKTASKTLNVSNANTLQNITLSGAESLTTLSKGQLTLHGNLKNGETIDISNETAMFTIIQASPEGAVELLSNGCITGRIAGTASIKAEVTKRGKQYESNVLTVTISESVQSSSVIKFNFTGEESDIRAFNDYTKDRNWAYFADIITKSIAIKQLATYSQIISQPGEWVALKVKISEAGNYKTTLSYLGYKKAGIMNLYLLPMTEDITSDINNNLTNAYLVDQVDGYSADKETLTKDLNDLYVPTAGEYLLVFQSAGYRVDLTTANIYPVSLLLEGKHALKSVALTLNSDEIEFNNTSQAGCIATLVDGTTIVPTDEDSVIQYKSSDSEIASVDETGLITAHKPGDVKISVSITKGNITAENSRNIIVTDNSELLSIELTGVKSVWVRGTTQLSQIANMKSGNVLKVPADTMTYTVVSCTPEGAATIDANGLITGLLAGSIQIKGTSAFKGVTTETAIINIPIVTLSKTESTIYTQEKREIIQENVKKYTWAASALKSVVKAADEYVGKEETLWNLVVPEGLPRCRYNSEYNDPEKFYCRYCGVNLQSQYGTYPWIIKPLTDPWKIQCPACKRRFPSNDFESYYKLGLDEHGIFNKELAKQKNDQLIANGQSGYLVNILYLEKGEGWGVDDGFGYFPGHTYENGIVERHNYVATYIHEGLWHSNDIIPTAIDTLASAYVYTGEAKYGRTGAILLDRVADLYPDYDWYQWSLFRESRGNDAAHGKTLDYIWENRPATKYAQAYDAFFPIYDDPQVIQFLSAKATQYKMENSKNTAASIRKNAEDGILREIYRSCVNSNIAGNFGMAQMTLASAAIAFDTMPETKEWLDWLMRPGENGDNPRYGGNVLQQMINVVDRDGNGNEASPFYNNGWLDQILGVAELLHDYGKYPELDLYNNPKFTKMFTAQIPLIMASYYTVVIGDSTDTASTEILLDKDNAITGFSRLGTPKLAQAVYMLNGNSVSGIHESIMTRNPEQIQQDITDVINKYGTLNLDSEMVTGYGFAALRDGAKYDSVGINATINNQRDFSIYFGRNSGHGHSDCLSLGIDAYGLNMAPDLGYPETTGKQPNRLQWVESPISHNTVMVDGRWQRQVVHGVPLHFDDSNMVKVVDIDAKKAYVQTDIYRRTVVMVEVNDDVSYGIDFFRIRGGSDHIYSFHSQSDEIFDTDGLILTPQVDANNEYVGTYAGADVPWGPDPLTDLDSWNDNNLKYKTGSTWLDAVRRDTAPQQTFSVDFKVKDFRDVLPDNPNLHLRMTMLNNFSLTEVAIAHGTPPKKASNMECMSYLEYVLARRTGTNLDTLFTTVYEPYKDTRYLESMTAVNTEILEGTQNVNDMVKAVKVTHKDGRIDYVIYATNNTVKYKIDNLFDFRGFVGVYTLANGVPVYSYLNDGDIIGDSSENMPAVTGVVEDFTRDLNMKNYITITSAKQIDLSTLTGKYIYIDNSSKSPENGAYKILGATAVSDNIIQLDIGDVTPIRAYKDDKDISAGYIYNIESGQVFRIPLPMVKDGSPVFSSISKKTVDANSQIRFSVSAESPIGKELTYSSTVLPRGASFNAETQEFVWTPDTKQIGINHVAIVATDGALSTTKHIEIKVLSATSGASYNKSQENSNQQNNSESNQQNNSENNQQSEQGSAVSSRADKFIDLKGYDWAKDAIDSLVKAGIINGTSENTFSPGADITRADFAIILVRAFNITSNSTDNFADVASNAYYADALAAAKGGGIITGVGNNNYNPTASISRQDMMVIIKRALENSDYKLEEANDSVLSEFTDSAEVSDYAKSAVAVLKKNGIIGGTGNKINPRDNATRAEVAILVQRILNKKI